MLLAAWTALLVVVIWLGQQGAWVGTVLGVIVLAFLSYLLWRSLQENRRGP